MYYLSSFRIYPNPNQDCHMPKFFLAFIGLFICNLFPLPAQDSLFVELEMTAISESAFGAYKSAYDKGIQTGDILHMDITGSIPALGLQLLTDCYEICEAHLQDTKSGEQLYLPSNFDAGIMDMIFSPDGNSFMVYSAYDGPGYAHFYESRSEIMVYSIEEGTGLQAIIFSAWFDTQDWSIADIVWVDSDSIALQVYEGEQPQQGRPDTYSYLTTRVNKREDDR